MGLIRAVIYIGRSLNENIAIRRCLDHCENEGYHLSSIVDDADEDVSRWRGAFAALATGAADVLIVATRDDLTRNQLPRIEVAGEQNRRPIPPQRRPKRR